MVDAYADYLKCVACFVYQPGRSERDALISSLYRLSLYAPISINDKAHELYLFVLDWARSGQPRAFAVDEKINFLRELMHKDIVETQRMGRL